MRHRALVLSSGIALFILGMVFAFNLGTEFFPSEDQGRLRVELELPADTSLEVTTDITKEMVDLIQQNKYVAYTYGEIGSGRGE